MAELELDEKSCSDLVAELELDEKSCSDVENENDVVDLGIGTLALHLTAPAPLPTNAVAVRRAKPPNNGIEKMTIAQMSNFAGDCAQTTSMVASLWSPSLWNATALPFMAY